MVNIWPIFKSFSPPAAIVRPRNASPIDWSNSDLAACVNILPGVQSVYRWQGAVESEAEVLMLIKTKASLIQEVQSTIASLHSYEVPEFLVLPILGGSEAYMAWLEASLD